MRHISACLRWQKTNSDKNIPCHYLTMPKYRSLKSVSVSLSINPFSAAKTHIIEQFTIETVRGCAVYA